MPKIGFSGAHEIRDSSRARTTPRRIKTISVNKIIIANRLFPHPRQQKFRLEVARDQFSAFRPTLWMRRAINVTCKWRFSFYKAVIKNSCAVWKRIHTEVQHAGGPKFHARLRIVALTATRHHRTKWSLIASPGYIMRITWATAMSLILSSSVEECRYLAQL